MQTSRPRHGSPRRVRFIAVTALLVAGLSLRVAFGQVGAVPSLPPPPQPSGQPAIPVIEQLQTIQVPQTGVPANFTVPLAQFAAPSQPGLSFNFTIEDNTPLSKLLPTPPKSSSPTPYVNDLAKVPEINFEEFAKPNRSETGLQKIALQIAKVNHLNRKKSDSFMEALLSKRSDLAGLPVVMGHACRMSEERAQFFNNSLSSLRNFLNTSISITLQQAERAPEIAAATFWQQFHTSAVQEDSSRDSTNTAHCDEGSAARIAALMQVIAIESPAMQKGMVKYLSSIAHIDATKALARLAIFAAADDVRQSAIDALKLRREKHYTDILVNGLRYPWPDVAKHASEAIVKLERTDLAPQLADFLGEADPRDPVVKKVDGKEVTVVREMVRINHHRNCLLCHAAHDAQAAQTHPGVPVLAQVPVPGEPLPSSAQGYQQSIPDVLVRADITYLRQDFSMLQPVADAHPWPTMQRFDFLVRTRTLTKNDAKAFADVIAGRDKDYVSPSHQAVLAALRRLTGRDAEPTRQAWRDVLGL